MNDEYLKNLSAVESELIQEDKGEGSLSAYVVGADESSEGAPREEKIYLGYDISPLDIEALFFEGIKLPRWESIEAESLDQHREIYQQSFQKVTAEYPLISRVSDTDQKVEFTSEEVLQLREECQRVLDGANDAKAVRAVQKFYIACNKAAERRMGLRLIPN